MTDPRQEELEADVLRAVEDWHREYTAWRDGEDADDPAPPGLMDAEEHLKECASMLSAHKLEGARWDTSKPFRCTYCGAGRFALKDDGSRRCSNCGCQYRAP